MKTVSGLSESTKAECHRARALRNATKGGHKSAGAGKEMKT